MDARLSIALGIIASLIICQNSVAQSYRAESENFIISAPSPRLARNAARLAEQYRKNLSIDWLGYEISKWREKCPVQIHIGPHAGGETSFAFVNTGVGRGEPISWQMKIYGPPDRLLDAVLPHEITHTIFATHFGQPLPRWADEGACTTVEHESERAKNHRMLISFLTSSPSRGIPFNRMFTMKQYPHDILPLYAQGYSVAKYLIGQKGRKHFINFLEYGMSNERSSFDTRTWDDATNQFYGYQDLSDLQINWIQWVRNGSQMRSQMPDQSALASQDSNLIDPNSTYAIAKKRPPEERRSVGEVADQADVARGDDSGQKLNSWYARQSRAKTPIASSDRVETPTTASRKATFLPGTVKQGKAELEKLSAPATSATRTRDSSGNRKLLLR